MRPRQSLGSTLEWSIGHFPMSEEDYDPTWPSMTWRDFLFCFDATPSSPMGRYIVMVAGKMYKGRAKVTVSAHVKYARDIRLLFSSDLKVGGRLYGRPFEDQVQMWLDLVEVPEHVTGWAVKSQQV